MAADKQKEWNDKVKQAEEIRKLAHLFEAPELCDNINASIARVTEQLKEIQVLWETAEDALIFGLRMNAGVDDVREP